MANADTVIVDIPSLREAIQSFRQCSTVLGDCVTSLQQNTSEIRAAVTSQASDIYQGKMQKLSSNVSSAQTELTAKVKELEMLCDKSEQAEKTAQGIAESLDSNFMPY